jgi:predicted ArsR family transcriptional regulator
METTKFGRNFFDSTRGRVIVLLRQGIDTVEELAKDLSLTDNAVRAHLATLERDGLVERRGMKPGLRKPHFAYALTQEAETLFPKAYSTLLNRLISVLKRRLTHDELLSVMREVGGSLSTTAGSPVFEEPFEARARLGVLQLEALGGAPQMVCEDEKVFIKSLNSCPFSDSTSEHPEICHLAEVLLSEITGLVVVEHCQRGTQPKCRFEITGSQYSRSET